MKYIVLAVLILASIQPNSDVQARGFGDLLSFKYCNYYHNGDWYAEYVTIDITEECPAAKDPSSTHIILQAQAMGPGTTVSRIHDNHGCIIDTIATVEPAGT
jgi:hypothetical protein